MKAPLIIAKILTCLLCLIIVGVALDSLPDPPAVKPPSIQKYSNFRLIHTPVSATANLASNCLSCRLQLHPDFARATQAFESAVLLLTEPFVLQAADASPPRRS